MHRHAFDIRIGSEAQRGHHESDAQIVIDAHTRAFDVGQVDPRAARYVVSGERHHGHSSRSEADCDFAVAEVAPEVNVETVWQTQAAQQTGHGLPVHPFGTSVGAGIAFQHVVLG